MKTFAFLIVFVLLAGLHKTTSGQTFDKTMPFVHVREFQIPKSRVDSLHKIIEAYDIKYKVYEKAIELGYVLDIRIYITDDVWNHRIEWVYPSWEAMNNPGWIKRTWEEVLPDSVKNEEVAAAWEWATKDVVTRSRIYRLGYGAR